MRFGGEIAAETMETLERSRGGGRDIFAKATHGEDQIDAGDIAEVKEATIGGAVGTTVFSFKGREVNR